jgi:hypothetical protein
MRTTGLSQHACLSIPGELAARAAFLAKLHREAGLGKWVERIVRERVEPVATVSVFLTVGFSLARYPNGNCMQSICIGEAGDGRLTRAQLSTATRYVQGRTHGQKITDRGYPLRKREMMASITHSSGQRGQESREKQSHSSAALSVVVYPETR